MLRKRGRPRQLDYVILSPHTKELSAAIEAKWVHDSRAFGKQRLIDDLLRLECVRSGTTNSPNRYFLVAGMKKAIEGQLLTAHTNYDGARIKFLPHVLSVALNTAHICLLENEDSPIYTNLKNYYRGYDLEVPRQLKTKLLADATGENARVLIWRVMSLSNRRTFIPS